MEIVYHIGANSTDNERLLRCLQRDAALLRRHHVALPGQSHYRRLIRETIEALDGATPENGLRDSMLTAIMGDVRPRRLILSNENFLAPANRIFAGGAFYPNATPYAEGLGNIFAGDEITLMLAVQNPATFIPACHARAAHLELFEFMGGLDPRQLRWSDVVARLRSGLPEARLVVWADEDTPLIWAEVLRGMAGLGPEVDFSGAHDLAESIMTPEGAARFRAYLARHKPADEAHVRRLTTAFLTRYAKEEEVVREIDLPGWDETLVAELSADYERDCAAIAARSDVTWIAP